NAFTPWLVVATLDMARVIVIESSLSFLGLGVQPPTPTWGGMLADGRVYISTAWWLATFPGLAILITVLGINLFGDGLRATLDPRRRLWLASVRGGGGGGAGEVWAILTASLASAVTPSSFGPRLRCLHRMAQPSPALPPPRPAAAVELRGGFGRADDQRR